MKNISKLDEALRQVEVLKKENKNLLNNLFKETRYHRETKRNLDCLTEIVKRQGNMKKIFWRIWLK